MPSCWGTFSDISNNERRRKKQLKRKLHNYFQNKNETLLQKRYFEDVFDIPIKYDQQLYRL